ncbi:Rap1a/Tai family immunity protein [Herbaspirillum seropedicae]|uniref:Rap1a/Tai family immunity protein n=1 Tax=Herbaspirillum seropedicae TaxID=964 RepID=UPI003FCDDF47
MITRNFLLAAAIVLAAPVAAHAQQPKINSGNYWVSKCASGGQDYFECVVFTAGAVDGLQVMMTEKTKLFCLPSEITFAQASAIFGKYLREHPEQTHLNASLLVAMAMNSAYPCSK